MFHRICGHLLITVCALHGVAASADGIPGSTAVAGVAPGAVKALSPVVKPPAAFEDPCILEGDYLRYYPEDGLRYSRTFEVLTIRCHGNTLFLGEDTANRKPLIHISGSDFEIENPPVGRRLGLHFILKDGIVTGLQWTLDTRPIGECYVYRQRIEANDLAAKRLATELLQDLAHGTSRPELFTPEYAAELFPDSIQNTYAETRSLVPPDRFDIFKRDQDEDELQYGFLIVKNDRAAVLHLRLTKENTIRWLWLDSGIPDDPDLHAKAVRFLDDASGATFRPDLVALSESTEQSAEKQRRLCEELKQLGHLLALKRTRDEPGANIRYLAVFQNGNRLLDLWMTEDGRIRDFVLRDP